MTNTEIYVVSCIALTHVIVSVCFHLNVRKDFEKPLSHYDIYRQGEAVFMCYFPLVNILMFIAGWNDKRINAMLKRNNIEHTENQKLEKINDKLLVYLEDPDFDPMKYNKLKEQIINDLSKNEKQTIPQLPDNNKYMDKLFSYDS